MTDNIQNTTKFVHRSLCQSETFEQNQGSKKNFLSNNKLIFFILIYKTQNNDAFCSNCFQAA